MLEEVYVQIRIRIHRPFVSLNHVKKSIFEYLTRGSNVVLSAHRSQNLETLNLVAWKLK